MKKQYKSSIIITKNYKITKQKKSLMVFPRKLFLDIAPEIKRSIVGISSD